MASSISGGDFDKWLYIKLRELNADEDVFGLYIRGILEGDETDEEKQEALEGILSAFIGIDIETVIKNIIQKWTNSKQEQQNLEPQKVAEDVEIKLAKLLENKCITTIVQKSYTPEELRIREQILSQYSQVQLDDADEDDEGVVAAQSGTVGAATIGGKDDKSTDAVMSKNTNAFDVAQAVKERREQAKIESKAKKDKDKEDREKQKQLREEKKEKRKTVKGERRR